MIERNDGLNFDAGVVADIQRMLRGREVADIAHHMRLARHRGFVEVPENANLRGRSGRSPISKRSTASDRRAAQSGAGRMHVMTSSLRTKSLQDTLRAAHDVARRVGVTRVTDTTWMDRIGIPVFASIRPCAHRHSLAVNAGKGRMPMEAKVGAYMEAIEFAYAESSNHICALCALLPHDIQNQQTFPHTLTDLGPILGQRIVPDKPIACVEMAEIFSGETAFVPAELVFSPMSEDPGQRIYGTSTNGLASGNTVRRKRRCTDCVSPPRARRGVISL